VKLHHQSSANHTTAGGYTEEDYENMYEGLSAMFGLRTAWHFITIPQAIGRKTYQNIQAVNTCILDWTEK
jgi:hypothetical protein